MREKGNHVITQATEHSSVLESCRYLEQIGFEVTYLPVDNYGRVDLEDFSDAIGPETILASIMWGNNEIGTVQEISSIGAICTKHGIVLHCDAAQTVGKVPVDMRTNSIDLLTVSGHKMGGPKGVGAICVRGIADKIVPLILGGGQEAGLRSGTHNVPGIVGLGETCNLARDRMEHYETVSALRNDLESLIVSSIDNADINGDQDNRLPHITNISFPGVDSQTLVAAMPNLVVGTGSACQRLGSEPSHVLAPLRKQPDVSTTSITIGLSHSTTVEEIKYAATVIIDSVGKLRRLEPTHI